jgi:hypothetical protein
LEEEKTSSSIKWGCINVKYPFHFLALRDWGTRLWLKSKDKNRNEKERRKYKKIMRYWEKNERHKALNKWIEQNIRIPIREEADANYWKSSDGISQLKSREEYSHINFL